MDSTFFHSIYPLTLMSRLSGLCHFSTESKQLLKFWICYSLVLVVFLDCLAVYQLVVELSDENNSKMFKFVSFLRLSSPTVARTCIYVTSMFKWKAFLHFLTCVNTVETIIQQTLQVSLPKAVYTKFQALLVFIILVAVSIQVFFAFAILGIVPAVLTMFNIVPLITQAQFISCVMLLTQYITVIIDNLNQMDIYHERKSFLRCIVRNQISDESHTPIIDHQKTNQTINVSQELVRYISVIKDDLNNIFSIAILSVIADNLLLTTFNLYMLIKNVTFDVNSPEFIQQISYLYTVLLNITQVSLIAFPCASADYQVSTVESQSIGSEGDISLLGNSRYQGF